MQTFWWNKLKTNGSNKEAQSTKKQQMQEQNLALYSQGTIVMHTYAEALCNRFRHFG